MEDRKQLKRKLSDRSKDSGRDNRLHVKNPYHNNSPDFAALAQEFPHLLGDNVQINPVSKKGYIDFSDNNSLRGLSKALLLKDFHVNVDIPENHLCPPLPNRINYLCWISDLLENSSAEMTSTAPTVLDIGVGPVCIFPILGNKLFGWKFVGSDVDGASIDMCQRNIDANPELKEHIRAVLVPDSNRLQEIIGKEYLPRLMLPHVGENNNTHSDDQTTPVSVDLRSIRTGHTKDNNLTSNVVLRGPVSAALFAMGGSHAQTLLQCEKNIATNNNEIVIGQADEHNNDRLPTVVMCNPPFYDTDEQIQVNERTVCTGSTSEMRTLGGEVAFISAIIYDSLLLKDRVLWYTSMVGKHSSLQPLKRLLSASGVPHSHYFVTTLCQGVTSRWVLAWTFSDDAARGYKKWLVHAQLAATTSSTAADLDVDGSVYSCGTNTCSAGKAITNDGSDNRMVESGDCVSRGSSVRDAVLSSVECDGSEIPPPKKEIIVYFTFKISMPNSGMVETMLPTDHDVLVSDPFRGFFHVDTEDAEPLVNDNAGSCQDSISALTTLTISLQGIKLNAVSRLIMAIEDTNKALAKDKDALNYQLRTAVERNVASHSVIVLWYDAMTRDTVPVKAYESFFTLRIVEADHEMPRPINWSDVDNNHLDVHVDYDVQNATGAGENLNHFVHKFHEGFGGNLWRTNRSFCRC